MRKEEKNGKMKIVIFIFCMWILISFIQLNNDTAKQPKTVQENNNYYSNNSSLDTRKFNILLSSENKDIEQYLLNYAKSKSYDVNIDYADTLEIMDKLNEGERYDAIWVSNSMWTYMINSKNVSLKNSKSIAITPVVFGIKKSKAQELGFIDKQVYTKDLIDAISQKKLKFAMSNPITTNSGASAYLGMLYTLAGNPVSITEENLDSQEIQDNLRIFFSGIERTAGTEDFLEQSFLQGDYEAVFAYESSIININKKLTAQGKEPLYAIYPADGVAICDNTFVYVDKGDSKKKDIFDNIQAYLLSSKCQEDLQKYGRRTWYGGINNSADKTVFNPEWGIDTTKYLNSVKFPNTEVIKKALAMYQVELRKPIHVVFCLDYSGSMAGTGIEELIKAMKFILSDSANEYFIQFSKYDKIDIVPFATTVRDAFSSKEYSQEQLIEKIVNTQVGGQTAGYDAIVKGIDILSNENTDEYNLSIILMTDGEINKGYFRDFVKIYDAQKNSIPIYAITFGEANERQLEDIVEKANGKVFDGTQDLVSAFKEVRGYN